MSQIPEQHITRYFFHFTHIDNLDSIVENGLVCTNLKNELKIEHVDVASESIQERRSKMAVPCGPKGVVHDYVPFYFCSVNPMFLSMLNSKNIDQPLMIILAIPIQRIEKDDAVFTNASANTAIPPTFYDKPGDLVNLDWPTIDGKNWGISDDDEKHRRMAEVLIHKKVSVDDIEYIIYWSDPIKNHIKKVYEEKMKKIPKLSISYFKNKYNFYFTKFMFEDRKSETLVTGPQFLKIKFDVIQDKIIKKRQKSTSSSKFLFNSIPDSLTFLAKDFCAVPELKGIYELETKNDVHNENVSDHTLKVISKLESSQYYKEANEMDKAILKFSAYFHDIGKGPKSKWSSGKQPVYPDHPVDSMVMLERILVQDILEISQYEIRMVCLLVGYHDLIGEIFGKGRNEEQLRKLIKNKKEFDMLSCLNFADVSAISLTWAMQYTSQIGALRTRIIEDIEDND